MKIGPVAALILSGIALCLLVLAPLGWRLGLWRYGIGLYWMMPVSGFVAAVAVILSVLTLARDWSQLRLRTRPPCERLSARGRKGSSEAG